jgi:3-hydroxyacyl-CoA dehydrogenase / enoyl-CoA hydratase / 3-hydroxybutyryl-CoA epimerase
MPIFTSPSIRIDRDRDGSAALILDVPGKSVNVFTRQVFADLDAALQCLQNEKDIPVLIVRSGKPSGFVAGADLNEFLAIKNEAEAEATSALGQRVFGQFAALPMPTIAAIGGPCLGGGLELALACDYRLVFDKANTQLGLPEVELGLLPGWGGTQRLPRAIGLERALHMILSGKRLGARDALRWGLADALATTETELRDQFARLVGHALQQGKVRRDRLPLRTWRQRFLEATGFGRRLLFRGAERLLRQRVPEDMPAPAEALAAIRTGIQEGMDAGLQYERSAAGRLALTPACRNLIGLFFQREQSRKLPEELRHAAPPEIKRIGVVGAGAMGAGIAQLAAVRGFEVVVQEINEEALGAGLFRIKTLFDKAVERRVLSEAEAAKRFTMLRGTVDWKGFDQVDLVIEAAVEKLDAKRAVFRELEARTRPGTVLATNTSSLLVASLQEGLRQPERVAGLHFFNPVHKMPLVEVARAPASSDMALSTLAAWSIALGKTPVVVRDSPGFVVNRILMPYLVEAVLLIGEGMKVDEIDGTMKRFGMPMGPLELLDQIGLDVAAHVAASMQPAMAGRFPSLEAFERLRANEWLGQKSGKGFYLYRGKKLKVNALAQNLLRSVHDPSLPRLDPALPPATRLREARERVVLLMVNEAALALAEGLAADAAHIDLAMVFGTGWAPHRGGPLHYADTRGIADVVRSLSELAARYGKRFEPCADLRTRVESSKMFVGSP